MIKVPFEKIYTDFESTKDVCKFFENYREDDMSLRFLLIRSLDASSLKEIISKYSDDDCNGSPKKLPEKAYNSSVSIKQLIEHIESKRDELIKVREAELEGLADILCEIPISKCGVRNDKVDDIVKELVRNKSLKSVDELYNELDDKLLPRIRQYILWSYFNQTSNDIIELYFLKHKNVIPTLRKIHDIDFFLKVEGKIIPFDLKFTHISNEYFNLASQGILPNPNKTLGSCDDFIISNAQNSEDKVIKDFYRQVKKLLNLPNYGSLSKNELIDNLLNSNNSCAIDFVEKITKEHRNYIPKEPETLHTLEWWNYKYQGERLFCNNNRLFVFLAFTDKFVDGRELKGKTVEIGKKINELLDNISESDIHTIHYHYDKEQGLSGDYEAKSLSTIYFE